MTEKDGVTLEAESPGASQETEMIGTIAKGIIQSCTMGGLNANQIVSVAGQVFNITHAWSMDQMGESSVPTALRMLADFLETEYKRKVN